ncbi:hypothetical protein D3C80_894730 [compost metagenome]
MRGATCLAGIGVGLLRRHGVQGDWLKNSDFLGEFDLPRYGGRARRNQRPITVVLIVVISTPFRDQIQRCSGNGKGQCRC